MKECSDIERCVQRLNLKRGSPRDLLAISSTIGVVRELFKCIVADEYNTEAKPLPPLLSKLLKLNEINIEPLEDIEKAFNPVYVSTSLSQGGFIKAGVDLNTIWNLIRFWFIFFIFLIIYFLCAHFLGYSKEIDHLRNLSENGEKMVKTLVDSYKTQHSLPFRLKHNRNVGFFLEISAERSTKIPRDSIFYICQNKKSSVTYKTQELGT